MRKLLALGVLLFANVAIGATYTVTNTNDSGAGSLRQAILDANANPGTDQIVFAIGSGPQVIVPVTLLPKITEGVTIDATTQPGYSGKPLITIDGSIAPYVLYETAGFYVQGPGTTIIGFAITDFRSPNATVGREASGITIVVPGVTVKRCYLGIAADGHTVAGNESGLIIGGSATGAVVGAQGAGNVISGNYYEGIEAWFPTGFFTVQNNIIGLDATGSFAVPNVTGCYFGGDYGAAPIILNNIFAGNNNGDFQVSASASVIKGNKVGVNASGQVVSPTYSAGFALYGTLGASVTNVVVGGTNPGDGNEFATGAYLNGVNAATFTGNNIHGALRDGIRIDLGSSCTFTNNQIHDNTGAGIYLVAGTGNRFNANSIYTNQGGIQLGAKIPLPNDPGDPDGGANFGQNYPVLTRAVGNGTTTHVTGSLNSTPSSTFHLEFFATQSCDASGYGEGKTLIGTNTVTTDASGNASFAVDCSSVQPGYVVTATATDAGNDTSEFSACVAVEGPGTFHFTTDGVLVNEGAGSVTLTVSRSNGAVGTATVDYATHDLTAKAPGDYTAASGTLTFADGETSKSISIGIVDDTISEPTEQFTVSLSNPTGGAGIGTPATETVSIIDNDPVVLSIDDVSIVEGNSGTTNAVFTISLPIPWTGIAFSVSATTADGTAHAGVDYIATNTSVSFNTGDQTKSVSVPIIGNTTPEPNKTFTISIGVGCCGLPGIAKGQGVCTILNDDHKIAPYLYDLVVGQSANFTIELGQPVAAPLTIPIVVSDPSIATVPASVTVGAGFALVNVPVQAKSAGLANITATLPASAGGDVLHASVNVHADGQNPGAPSITSVRPASGPAAGGTAVTISGANFTADCSVSFGATPAVIGSRSATAIVATTPPSPSGAVDVSVTCGSQTTTATNAFLYLGAMTVSGISPAIGSTGGGTVVRITGNGFDSQCWPFFGATPAHMVSANADQIVATTPSHAAGTVDVALRCAGGSEASLASAFVYTNVADAAPIINSLAPFSGAPGQNVSILGARFRTSDIITFGTARARVVATAPDQHTVVVPDLDPGLVSVSVTDTSGRTTTTGPVFTVLAPLAIAITGATPATVAPDGELTITGSGFRPSVHFQLDATPLLTLSLSATNAIVRLPLDAPLGVHTLRAGDATGPAITVGTAPVITGVAPLCTLATGGATIIISGSGFVNGATVTLGGSAATSVVVQENRITAVAPSGDTGAAMVTVTNPDGSTATFSAGFRYVSPFDPDPCAPRPHAAPH